MHFLLLEVTTWPGAFQTVVGMMVFAFIIWTLSR